MIAFLLSPVGRALAGVIAAGLVVWGIYTQGVHAGRAACEARVAAEVAAERQRQAEAGNAALDAARRREEAASLANQSLQQQVDDYAASLAARPDAACLLSPDDARGLSGIR